MKIKCDIATKPVKATPMDLDDWAETLTKEATSAPRTSRRSNTRQTKSVKKEVDVMSLLDEDPKP